MKWLDRLFRRQEPSSAVAKNRLRMVLTHDRANISPGLMEQIKDDIVEVIARHLTVDAAQVEVNLTRGASETRLVAEIPLRSVRKAVK